MTPPRGLQRGATLPGEVAFKLYDTYGFPYDLTEDALKARGLGVDAQGFAAAMERQRAEARKSWAGSGEAATEALWFELKEELGATEFLGYGTEAASAEIVALIKDGARVRELKEGERGIVIVNQTPFYGESGGQVGDRGVIAGAKGARFKVEDTQKKLHGLLLHEGVVEQGALKLGEEVAAEVDHARRTATRAHHSATHLLHEALRQVLGTHVAQKGSLVEPGRLRFDFSHQKPMTHDEIRAVEDLVNAMILQNAVVETHLMTPDQAIAQGALALFGEKYGDEVRVVSMGVDESSARAGHAYSIELCGGTHVRRTGDIGLLKIVGESAVASGVRRIEALTAEAARAYLAAQDERVREAAELLKVSPDEVIQRLAAIIDERRKLERQLAEAKRELALGGSAGGAAASAVQELGNSQVPGPRPCRAWRPKICAASSTTASGNWAPASLPLSASARRARRPSSSASPQTSFRPTMPSSLPVSARKLSAAKAVAGAPTWRRPAAPTAHAPSRRSKPSRQGSPAAGARTPKRRSGSA